MYPAKCSVYTNIDMFSTQNHCHVAIAIHWPGPNGIVSHKKTGPAPRECFSYGPPRSTNQTSQERQTQEMEGLMMDICRSFSVIVV